MGIAPLLQVVVGLGRSWLDNKKEKQKQEHEIESERNKARIRKIQDDQDRAGDLDIYFANNSKGKRNVSFYLAMLPVIAVFYPPALPHVIAGFDALQQLPQWYLYGLGAMMISIWSFRRILNGFINMKLKKFIGDGKKND